ncbi:hypothetical protein [Streptosporangium roseum]|uniref:Uncharacterized protein n=1 Tax=Streptosporangium roseum (strain ATCC 12428 / DSM 43021 / JCM 3005 / KCTC 9067 / NCIMB 10171 / NRRL 2505 / NI 9100) TaxID=479432 RepID=D2B369_STRRD|nr:hypothetical protein [Streptosporangium roseum]ACZ85549.1 hypothetical protein Sros_2578 [Streptosporangium roseum DSM 43021]
MTEQAVASGLALLGVPPLPDLDAIDRHITELDEAAARHQALATESRQVLRLASANSGPAADAANAHVTGRDGTAATAEDLAHRLSVTAGTLRSTRGVLVWVGGSLAGLGLLAVAAVVHAPQLLPRLRALAARFSLRLREIIARIGALMRGMSTTLTNRRVDKIASRFHDRWREPRKLSDNTYEPRVKATTDSAWIKKHGTDQVDIANTRYRSLPADWQHENRESARIGVQLVDEARASGVNVRSERFMEEASSVVHDRWLTRNGSWASEEQRRPYELLSMAEKEKDRDVIRTVLGI